MSRFFTSLLLLLTLSLLVSGMRSEAQELSVRGRVLTESDSTEVVGAAVRLRDTSGATLAGVATGEDGSFVIKGDGTKTADLYISYVSMLPATIGITGAEKTEIDLGTIYLVSDEEMLDELVVQGQTKRIDREIVFPDAPLVKASPDVLTLLSNLSLSGLSVNLIEKTATIRDQGIYWMIDGVPKTIEDILRLDPKAVLRIEYSDLQTIRLTDRGQGGYVNVILKERTDGGSLRTSLQSAITTGFVNGSASGNYHRGKSDFTISYSCNYRNYPHWRQDGTQTFIKPDLEISREEKGEDPSPMTYTDQSIDLTYLYRHDKSNLWSLTWRNGFGRQIFDIRSEMRETGREDYRRRSYSSYRGYVPALDGYYKHTFEDGGVLESNLVGAITRGENNRDLTDMVGERVTDSVSNPVKNRYYSLVGEIFYGKSVHPKVYLSLGLQNSFGRSSNLYLSDNYTDRLNQNNTYLYGQISGRLSETTQYSLGTGVKILYTADPSRHRTFVKNQTALALWYMPVEGWNFSLASTLTPLLPSLSQLSPVSQRFDDLITYSGNPDLKPGTALSNRLTISHWREKFSTDLDLTYSHTFDPIYPVIRYDRSGDLFVNSPVNGRFDSRVGAKLNLTWQNLFDFLTIVGNAGYNYFRSDPGDNPLDLHDFYWNLSLVLSYKDFSLTGFYADDAASLRGHTIERPGVRTGLALMWSGSKVTLYAQMLYAGIPDGDVYHTESLSRVAPSTESIVIPDNGNMLTLGLVWNFSFGKKGERINRSLSNYDTDDSMVKVQR